MLLIATYSFPLNNVQEPFSELKPIIYDKIIATLV